MKWRGLCIFFFPVQVWGYESRTNRGCGKSPCRVVKSKKMADPGRTRKRGGGGGAAYKLFLTQCKGGGSGIDSGRPVS